MTQPSVARFWAENFRGIRSASVPVSGMNLVTVGENGSGKSCFVDLLEYLFTGRLARLQRQDVRERESIPFVGRRGGEPVRAGISLALGGSVYDIHTGYPYSEPELASPVSGWFRQLRAHPPILRRAQILDFVEAKGASRYKQISTIVGLDDIDEVLGSWRKLELEARKRKESSEAGLQDARSRLRELLEVTGQANLVDGVNLRLAEVGMPPVSAVRELEEGIGAPGARAGVAATAQEATRLVDYAATIDWIEMKARAFLSDYAAFHGTWATFAKQKDAWKDALFRELLDQGRKVLVEFPDLEVCPLCQAPIERVQLMESLRPRIAELDLIRERKETLEAARAELARQAAQISQQVAVAISGAYSHRVPVLTGLAEGLERMDQVLQGDVLDGQYPTPKEVQESPWAAAPASLAAASSSLKDEAAKLKPSELEQKCLDVATWLGRVGQAWKDEQQAIGATGAMERLCLHLDLMNQAVTGAREDCLGRIHADIESRINVYYQELHPEEGYGEIQLPVERKGQAVGLRTAFHGVQGSHPSGFYSEGHLDCVGIATFLAFTRRSNQAGSLLVLDDVLTTIDSAHRQRLAILLAREFRDYQMIITTHDRLWAEELLTTMAAYGLPRLALHLQAWTVERGVEWVEFLEQRWDEYKRRAGDNPQSAVGDTGRDLERLLCIMRYNLLLSVPARLHDQYTIGDLYDPFFAWFRRRSVQRQDLAFDSAFSGLQQAMDVYWRMRNWSGSHYNTWGATLSPAEAGDFITLVETLHGLLQCPRCSSLVQYDEHSCVLYCPRCRGTEGGAAWRVVRKSQRDEATLRQ